MNSVAYCGRLIIKRLSRGSCA